MRSCVKTAIPVLRNNDKTPLAVPVFSFGTEFKMAVLTEGWKNAFPTPMTICIKTKKYKGVNKFVLLNKNRPTAIKVIPRSIFLKAENVPVEMAVSK